MKFRVILLAAWSSLLLQAQTEMNVDQLAQFVRSELALKQQTDKQLGLYLKKEIHLSEKLTDKTIEDLEAQGAGPRTVDALHALRDQTANMKPPTHDSTYSPATAPDAPINNGPANVKLGVYTPIPPPTSVRQQEILDEIKQYALTYTQNLPNFICLQVTRRYVDPNSSGDFHLLQTINAQLTYHGGEEDHKVISVNGKLTNANFEEVGAKIGGATSTGEFGGMMRSIFEDRSQAQFAWEKWATLRGKRMAVFNYSIESSHSDYHIRYEDTQQIITAYRGLVYADENTGAISRITLEAVNIPRSFPLDTATERLDFGDAEINGQTYICPLAAELHLNSGRQKDRNDIEFRLYHKFGIESKIQYGAIAPDPLSESQTQEQPGGSAKLPAASKATQAAAPKNDPWTLPTLPPPPPQ